MGILSRHQELIGGRDKSSCQAIDGVSLDISVRLIVRRASRLGIAANTACQLEHTRIQMEPNLRRSKEGHRWPVWRQARPVNNTVLLAKLTGRPSFDLAPLSCSS
jgi:hypothetical protein